MIYRVSFYRLSEEEDQGRFPRHMVDVQATNCKDAERQVILTDNEVLNGVYKSKGTPIAAHPSYVFRNPEAMKLWHSKNRVARKGPRACSTCHKPVGKSVRVCADCKAAALAASPAPMKRKRTKSTPKKVAATLIPKNIPEDVPVVVHVCDCTIRLD